MTAWPRKELLASEGDPATSFPIAAHLPAGHLDGSICFLTGDSPC